MGPTFFENMIIIRDNFKTSFFLGVKNVTKCQKTL